MTKPASHTPGPWSLVRYYGSSFSIEPSVAWLGASTSKADSTNEANAKLIAASTDLLEALIGMIEMFQHDDEASTAGTDAYIAIVLAKAAIAKATGDQ